MKICSPGSICNPQEQKPIAVFAITADIKQFSLKTPYSFQLSNSEHESARQLSAEGKSHPLRYSIHSAGKSCAESLCEPSKI
jgi:hypothetical protein